MGDETPVVEKPVDVPVPAAPPEVKVSKIESCLVAQIAAGLLGNAGTMPSDVQKIVGLSVQYAKAILDAVDKANGGN